MSRVFITGDTHRDINIQKLLPENFPTQLSLTKKDILIIAGDFGTPWAYGERSSKDHNTLRFHNNRNYTTVFVDGNHENFDQLYTYSTVEFLGAECHQIRPSVYHVKRGQVLQIDDRRIWCFGGANSIDKEHRTEFISWWSQEEPNYREWETGIANLDKSITHIVTHECPTELVRRIWSYHGESPVSNHFSRILDILLEENINIEKWFFGHHHIDEKFNLKGIDFECVYNNIVEI